MPTMNDVLRAQHLSDEDSDHLHLLVGEWQLIADLSFADLVLWVRGFRGQWVAAAHVRPITGVSVFSDDLVGDRIDPTRARVVDTAYRTRTITRVPQTVWRGDVPVREEAVPVTLDGRVAAMLTRHTNLASMRTPSRLEVTYLATADALCRMIRDGEFPRARQEQSPVRGAPRVGDGVVRLDAPGKVTYASPNAVSAVHRLGHEGAVVGEELAGAVRAVLPRRGTIDEDLTQVLRGRVAGLMEVRTDSATVVVHTIPLVEQGEHAGAVVLVRDVSELRRRERELATKDTAIREIHHRVKNNLQTVAAVLRLQARRVDDPSGKAALVDAGRRVATIAAVHETLSTRLDDKVEFDEIAERVLQASLDLANRAGTEVTGRLTGTFGKLSSEDATPIAMVLAELCQNAVEHGFARRGGDVLVTARRGSGDRSAQLTVSITDTGEGLPDGFDAADAGLGTQIVRSLVTDMGGEITWERLPRGTAVRFQVQLRGSSQHPG